MSKKKKIIIKIIIFLIIILIIGIAAFLGYNYFKEDSDDNNEVKIVKSIPLYDYNLNENETNLYNNTFEELVKVLGTEEVSYEEYAKIVAKLFIIDFYTLNNKLSKNDVGGTDFIHPDMVNNFIEEARSTFYKYIKSNPEGNQDNNLPEVSSIDEIFVEETTFKINNGEETNAYRVSISWSYKIETNYEKEAKMILVLKDKKLYIVEMN